MNILSFTPARRAPSTASDAGDQAARDALGETAGAPASLQDCGRVCGWFDSSWELQQGLAISEMPEAELPVAALWFAELMPRVLPEIESAQFGP